MAYHADFAELLEGFAVAVIVDENADCVVAGGERSGSWAEFGLKEGKGDLCVGKLFNSFLK